MKKADIIKQIKGHALPRVFMITALALLMLTSISSAAPFSYVTSLRGNTVSVIDTATDTPVNTIHVGNSPFGFAISPDRTRVYITNFYDNTVSVINAETNTVAATINVGVGPEGIAVSPDGTKAYVANSGSNTVSVIDTSTNSVTTTVRDAGNVPYGIAVSPDGTKIYVTNYKGKSILFKLSGNLSISTH